MPNLVAIDLAGGEAFVAALQRIWQRGDAAMPLDQRLPPHLATALIEALGAASIIDGGGEHAMSSGKPVEPGDALVVATSGSTGVPKGVVLTHAAVAASAVATTRRLGTTRDDHWLACLPLSHVGGLAVVTRALHSGAELTVLPRFDPHAVAAATRTGVTSTSLVPTALARVDPSIFRWIVLGGSHPPPDRPGNVVSTYGLTETGSGVAYDGVPLEGVEIQIAPDGEVLIRCPMQLRCYRNGTSPVDSQGWLHTNDLGRVDPDGRLHVDGRRGDLIISGGENVWPDVVEAVLVKHRAIADVGVVGVADHEWGQIVTAYIVPAESSSPPTLDEIRAWVRERLPAFMAPRSIVLVDALPRTSIGKLQRSLLGAAER